MISGYLKILNFRTIKMTMKNNPEEVMLDSKPETFDVNLEIITFDISNSNICFGFCLILWYFSIASHTLMSEMFVNFANGPPSCKIKYPERKPF